MLVNINNLKPYQHLLGGTTNHRSTTEGVQEYSDIYGDEDDEAMPWQPQIDNGNLVINTIDNFDDSLVKSIDLVDISDDDIIELEQITTYMVEMMKDEREDGDNGIWMNEEY